MSLTQQGLRVPEYVMQPELTFSESSTQPVTFVAEDSDLRDPEDNDQSGHPGLRDHDEPATSAHEDTMQLDEAEETVAEQGTNRSALFQGGSTRPIPSLYGNSVQTGLPFFGGSLHIDQVTASNNFNESLSNGGVFHSTTESSAGTRHLKRRAERLPSPELYVSNWQSSFSFSVVLN